MGGYNTAGYLGRGPKRRMRRSIRSVCRLVTSYHNGTRSLLTFPLRMPILSVASGNSTPYFLLQKMGKFWDKKVLKVVQSMKSQLEKMEEDLAEVG